MNKKKIAAGALMASAAFFASLIGFEGYRSKPYLDSGGVATIGIGSITYEDGTRVKMTDAPITKERATHMAKAYLSGTERMFKSSLYEARLSQVEYDLYLDFVYQYGMGAWNRSSMRRHIIANNHKAACQSLLLYKYVAKKDCSIRSNNCYGVWTRQLKRHEQCMEVNR